MKNWNEKYASKKEAGAQSQQVSPVAEHYLGTLNHDVVKQNTLGMGLNNAAVRHSDVRNAVAGQGQMGPASLMASQAHQRSYQQHNNIANALKNIDPIVSAAHTSAANLHLDAANAHSLTSNMIKNNAPGHGPSDTGSSTSARGAEFATQLISNHNDAVSKSSSANAATVNANSSKINYGTPPLPERIGSFDERYAIEKEAGIVEHLPMIDALGHGARAVAETAFNYVKGLGQDIANVAGHPGPHGTDAPAGTELKSMLDLAANAAGGMAIKKKAPAAIDALKNKLEQRRDQKATNKSWNSIQDSGILEDK